MGPAVIKIHVLGGLSIEAANLSETASARRRHPLAVLAVIAVAAPSPVPRDRLLELLWPGRGRERAGNSLRQTLFRLRRDLGDEVFLDEGSGGIRLHPEHVEVDLWHFQDAIQRGDLEEAVEAYGGPFLDGFAIAGLAEFAAWIETERTRIRRQLLDALDTLAARAEEEGRADDAVAWRRRQAAADPHGSRTALALLRALVTAGDRTGALEYARIHETLVRQSLGVDPDPAVTEFVRTLEEVRTPHGEPTPEVEPRAGRERVPDVESGARSAAPRASPWHAIGWTLLGAAATLAVVFGSEWRPAGQRGETSGIRGPIPGTVLVLGSAHTNVDGRDSGNLLVACEGPACPEGPLPQPAYVVSKHEAYNPPVAGTGFIAPVPDGTARPSPGFPCCTTAIFEAEFELPADATTGRISLSMLADNQGIVEINGVEFGRHPDPHDPSNYGGPAKIFNASFPPAPEGTNRLRLTLWNGGGSVALQYNAVVTYQRASDEDDDGIPDDEDPFPRSNLQPTVVLDGCDSAVENRFVSVPRGATLSDLIAGARAAAVNEAEAAAALSSMLSQWLDAGWIGQEEFEKLAECLR